MNQPITLKVKYTVDDFIRVAKFIQNQSFIFRHDVIITAGIVFLGFVILIILMASDLPQINVLGVLIFSAIPAIIIGLAVYLMHGPIGSWLSKRRVTKLINSSPIMNEENLIEFSNEGIKTTGNLSSSFVKWGGITKVLESKSDIIIYTSNYKFGWCIPKNAFDSNEDLIAVKILLRQVIYERAKLL